MTDEEIIESIQDWQRENNIHDIYMPTIEAYYIRARQRYQWNDNVLKQKLSELRNLKKIVVAKLKDDNVGAQLFMNRDNTCKMQVNESIIKDILDGEDAFETFFNCVLHELTHFEKSRELSKPKNRRITSLRRINNDGTTSANMVEELATVVNTELLQNGTIETDELLIGYTDMQYYFNIVLAAMGMARKEFADLQELGREGYDDYIIKKFGSDNLLLIYSLEDMLDTIRCLNIKLGQKNINTRKLRNNRALQGRNLIKQSYNLLIKRIEIMRQKPKQEISKEELRIILENGKTIHDNSKHVIALPESKENKSSLDSFFNEFIDFCHEIGMKDEEIKKLKCREHRKQKLYDWGNGIIDYNTRVAIRDKGIPRTEIYESRIDIVKETIKKVWRRIRGRKMTMLLPGL